MKDKASTEVVHVLDCAERINDSGGSDGGGLFRLFCGAAGYIGAIFIFS